MPCGTLDLDLDLSREYMRAAFDSQWDPLSTITRYLATVSTMNTSSLGRPTVWTDNSLVIPNGQLHSCFWTFDGPVIILSKGRQFFCALPREQLRLHFFHTANQSSCVKSTPFVKIFWILKVASFFSLYVVQTSFVPDVLFVLFLHAVCWCLVFCLHVCLDSCLIFSCECVHVYFVARVCHLGLASCNPFLRTPCSSTLCTFVVFCFPCSNMLNSCVLMFMFFIKTMTSLWSRLVWSASCVRECFWISGHHVVAHHDASYATE